MKLFSFLLIFFAAYPLLAQDDFLTLDDGTKLYIEEAGEGKTLLFIPGWTMTHRFFENQKTHFAEQYHVVTYDPRGQGRSEKTEYGNTYADHAADLRQILLKKNLDDVVLIGWSSGCLAMYEYIRAFGFERISKMVLIDEPPKWIGDSETEWVYGSFDDYRSSLKSMISKPSDPNGIIDWMLANPVDSLSRRWMKEEILMTPKSIALNLYIDGLICDYTKEITKLGTEMPALFMVRSSWYDKAKSWLERNVPNSEVKSISSHAMFWEQPDAFNALLIDFLNSN